MVAPPGRSETERQGRGGPIGGSNGSRNGNNQGGLSPSLLDSKYPGAKGKKNRQYEASLENLGKIGTMIGKSALGPAGAAAVTGLEAAYDALSGTNPIAGALDPFTGRMADVPSAGAGYAQGSDSTNRMLDPALKAMQDRNKVKNKKQPLTKGFKLLAGAGGTLLGS